MLSKILVNCGSAAAIGFFVVLFGPFEHNPAWLFWVAFSAVVSLVLNGIVIYRFLRGRKILTDDEDVPKPVTDQKQKDRDAIYWLTERLRDNAEAVKRLKEINASLFDKHHNLTEAGNADK